MGLKDIDKVIEPWDGQGYKGCGGCYAESVGVQA